MRQAFCCHDGTVINAPTEQSAWEAFLGIDGEFKMPSEKNYDIENVGLAYEFDGDFKEWIEAVKMGSVE